MNDTNHSLETRLADVTDQRERIDLLIELVRQIHANDVDRALELCQEARQLSTSGEFAEKPYQVGLANSLAFLGDLYGLRGNYTEGHAFLLQAQTLFEQLGDILGQIRVKNWLGIYYFDQGDYVAALQNFFRTLEMARQSKNFEYEAGSLSNIGFAYNHTGDYELALTYLSQALEIFEIHQIKRGQADANNNSASALHNLNRDTEALVYALRAVEMAKQANAKTTLAEAYNILGTIYTTLGDLDQALNAYQQSLSTGEEIGHHYESTMASLHIGQTYLKQQAYEQAFEHLNNALYGAQQVGLKRLIYECHLALVDAYRQTENFGQALWHYEQYHLIKEAVFNERSDLRLKMLQVEHQVDTAQKEAEIYQLRNVELEREVQERKKAQTALEELATTDPLTGLFNRRQFFYLAEMELQRSIRYNHPLSVFMIDVDHFKDVNDTLGHAIGDQVLVAVAQRIKLQMRQVDIVSRYGGDEFIILLPETNMEQAGQIAQRLVEQVKSGLVNTVRGPVEITISVGVGCYNEFYSAALDALLERADHALYVAKQSGRNRAEM
jgi:diguanylate cyclase (GGDEF)-like protein